MVRFGRTICNARWGTMDKQACKTKSAFSIQSPISNCPAKSFGRLSTNRRIANAPAPAPLYYSRSLSRSARDTALMISRQLSRNYRACSSRNAAPGQSQHRRQTSQVNSRSKVWREYRSRQDYHHGPKACSYTSETGIAMETLILRPSDFTPNLR